MLVRENDPSADDIEAAMYMSRCNLLENVYLFVGPPPGQGRSCFAFGKDPTPIPKSFCQCQFCGRIYIGPPGPAGVRKDRQVTLFQDGVLVTAWVDPTVTARYGTMVFARCGVPAATAAATQPAAAGITLPPATR